MKEIFWIIIFDRNIWIIIFGLLLRRINEQTLVRNEDLKIWNRDINISRTCFHALDVVYPCTCTYSEHPHKVRPATQPQFHPVAYYIPFVGVRPLSLVFTSDISISITYASAVSTLCSIKLVVLPKCKGVNKPWSANCACVCLNAYMRILMSLVKTRL